MNFPNFGPRVGKGGNMKSKEVIRWGIELEGFGPSIPVTSEQWQFFDILPHLKSGDSYCTIGVSQ